MFTYFILLTLHLSYIIFDLLLWVQHLPCLMFQTKELGDSQLGGYSMPKEFVRLCMFGERCLCCSRSLGVTTETYLAGHDFECPARMLHVNGDLDLHGHATAYSLGPFKSKGSMFLDSCRHLSCVASYAGVPRSTAWCNLRREFALLPLWSLQGCDDP